MKIKNRILFICVVIIVFILIIKLNYLDVSFVSFAEGDEIINKYQQTKQPSLL
jgi:hypothetical protein